MEDVQKYIDRRSLDRNSGIPEPEKAKPPKKEGKSPFDELLEQGRRLSQGAIDTHSQSKQATQEAVKATEKFKERFQDQKKEKEREEESRAESRESRRGEIFVGKKVIGKGGLKEESGGQGGTGHGEQGTTGKQRKRFAVENYRKLASDSQCKIGSEAFAQMLQKKLAAKGSTLPKQLSQEILNNIIRHVKIGLSEKGKKEMELTLHRNIFKGLRLRIASNHGKVYVHFLTANGGVRELFVREKSTIQKALESKGIAVGEIRVT